MPRICIVLLFWFVLPCSLFSQSSAQPSLSLQLKTFTLPNGLTVYINEDPYATEVYGAVAVRAGGKYDPKEATGMAHYLEHMCFKGTDQMGTFNYAEEKPLLDKISQLYDQLGQTKDEKERAKIQQQINEVSVQAAQFAIPNDMDRLLSRMGGRNINAFTSYEAVVYFNSFPAHQMVPWLDLNAHRFQNPVFRLFQSELETVYEEKNRSMDNFTNALFEGFLSNFYKNHPYGQQTILGETEHLKNPSISKMQAYYDTYFVPNNMGLLISGPVKVNEIMPEIERLYGAWKRKAVPVFPKYEEKPFKGREIVKMKVSPVKLVINGWRTVPAGHPDELALEVCVALLNNSGETGLLDQLTLDNRVMAAACYPQTQVDHGALGIFVVPKLVGQSIANAENLVQEQIERLRKGEFSDTLYDAVCTNMIRDHELGMESSDYRSQQVLGVFIENRKWDDVLNYGARIRRLNKADIQRVAQKYLNENYLALESRMGFPKKDELQKPAFKPVTPPDGTQSLYAKHLESVQPGQPQPRFIVPEKDAPSTEWMPGRTLYVSTNPVNDICDLTLTFGLGTTSDPLLDLATSYMGQVGPAGVEIKAYKQQLYTLGYTSAIHTDGDEVSVTLTGPEERLADALRLLHQWMVNPDYSDKARKKIIEDLQGERKLEKGEAASMARPLHEYAVRGRNSRWLLMPNRHQLKDISTWDLINSWQRAYQTAGDVHYVGKRSTEEVRFVLQALEMESARYASNAPKELPLMHYDEPTILYHPRKDARQSQVYFYVEGERLTVDSLPMLDAFNNYFGGDMSSLVFQEIREFRSLAYSATGTYRRPNRPNATGYWVGYIGCQGDKTYEAMEVMQGLIEKMPEKREREPEIREALVQQAYTTRPEFRNISTSVSNWQDWGYSQDPSQVKLPAYQQMQFDAMVGFYKRHLTGKPLVIAIVGNPSVLSVEKLSKFGKVIEVKEQEFYNW